MFRKLFLANLTVMAVLALTVRATQAEHKGLPDLDAAIEQQIEADSNADLDRVVRLCELAISKGLDDDQRRFAVQLMTATLYRQASVVCRNIFERQPPSPLWRELRREALPKLDKAIRHDPKLDYAQLLIAKLHALPGGDQKKAIEAAGAAIRWGGAKKSRLAEALVLRASLSDDQQQKLADYNQALVVDPKNEDALRMRGAYHLSKENYDKAVADFSTLLEIDPNNELAHSGLAESLTVQEKYDEALKHINRTIQANPKSAIGYTLRARVRALKNDLKAAKTDLDKALDVEPRNVAALLMRARLHQADGDSKSARRDVQRALLIRPTLVEGVLLRSMISAAEGDFDAAIMDMRRLTRADPANLQWRLRMAAYCQAGQRPRQAIEIFTSIIEQDPKNLPAIRGRGDALLSVGKHAEAVIDYEAALKLDPENSGALNNLAWVLATSPQEKVRDGKRSIELGQKACEVTKYKQAHIVSTLAAGYAEAGDFESALKWSAKAVEMGAGETLVQLKKELESYEQKKPWRDLQEVKERPEPDRGGGDFDL